MSKPFAGATKDGVVRVIQLCTHHPWTSSTSPVDTTVLNVGAYKFMIDLHPVGTKITYTRFDDHIDVKYWNGKESRITGSSQPQVGVISCDDVNTGITTLTPSLLGLDVLFHLGDSVYLADMYPKYTARTSHQRALLLNALARQYIQTWDRLPMSHVEHRFIPDDSNFASDTLLESKQKLDRTYFETVVYFTDMLYLAINGAPRDEGHYYATQLVTPTTQYIAISNWLPIDGIPRFVENETLLSDLRSMKPETSQVVLMLSRCTFAITHTGYANYLLYAEEYAHNANNYCGFAELQRQWGVQLTVVCGDMHLPISMEIIPEDTKKTSHPSSDQESKGKRNSLEETPQKDRPLQPYTMHSTGTLSGVIESHIAEDLKVGPKAQVKLIPLPIYLHLHPGNSYLRFVGNKAQRIYADQDVLHSAFTGFRYLLNGH